MYCRGWCGDGGWLSWLVVVVQKEEERAYCRLLFFVRWLLVVAGARGITKRANLVTKITKRI
jgi:hypothetical protein